MNPRRRRYLSLQRLNQQLNHPLSDRILNDIAMYNPLKLEDFRAISGLGDTFIEQDGQTVLNFLVELQNQTPSIDDLQRSTLEELSKKLINLSRRNRLLYTGKLSNKQGYDLSSLSPENFHNLLFNNEKIILKSVDDDGFKPLYHLLQQISKQHKETGNYDGYIGYPYVEGRFLNDDFIIRAPLAFFPIKATASNQQISVEVNRNEDVLINSNLIVAKAKFTQEVTSLTSPYLEEVNDETFVEDLLSTYAQLNFEITHTPSELVAFIDKSNDDFKSFKPGQFHCIHHAILGYFPMLSTALQRDFDQLIDFSSLPTHLQTLLSTLDDEDIDESTTIDELSSIEYHEKDLVFIQSLNASQEAAQVAIRKGQSIVIQGPPGTGKSQTITNIISDLVSRNRKVLMVSEKKAAIDVVYQRLGSINNYSILLSNMNDKVSFYQQLSHLFDLAPPPTTNLSSQIDQIDQSIDQAFNQLNDLSNLLKDNREQKSLLDLYLIASKLDLNDHQIFEQVSIIKNYLDQHPNTKLDHVNQSWYEHQQLLHKYPIIQSLNPSLTQFEVLEARQKLDQVVALQKTEAQQSLLNKWFKPKESKQLLSSIIAKLYLQNPPSDLTLIADSLNNYFEWVKAQSSQLDPLFEVFTALHQSFNLDIDQAKDLFISFSGFEQVEKGESSNRALLSTIQQYPDLVLSIKNAHQQKAKMIVEQLTQSLHEKVSQLNKSKRSLEMKRIIERKRKMNIRKFMDQYGVELINACPIWLATPDVVSEIFPLHPNLFDCVIFDEASQMYIERAIPSLYRGEQVVIAGDSKQLRPSAFGVGRLSFDEDIYDDQGALDEESLLDLARFRYPSTMLNTHYRSEDEPLIAFSNAAFYQNKLIMSPATKIAQDAVIQVHKVDGLWQNRINSVESQKVVELIEQILKEKPDYSIGVITFNATQRAKIEEDLLEKSISDASFGLLLDQAYHREDDQSLFVKNIENVQGDERDIIIFSFAYGPNEDQKVTTQFGWLNQEGGENRLNVAITRSKKQIHIVTSITSHQLLVDKAKYAGPKRLRDYLAYCEAVSDQNLTKVASILDNLYPTPLVQSKDDWPKRLQLFVNHLKDHGLEIDENLGLGAFTIDLAVKKDNAYKLALFFDYYAYQKHSDTRLRDYHLENYLSVRGWKTHRVFAYNIYHNMEQEIADILQIVKEL